MKRTLAKLLSIVALAASITSLAQAITFTYVGSWDVYDNPNALPWAGSPPNGPLAYTAQEAAALIFGGSAADYAISTVSSLVSDINNMAHYDVIGYGHNLFAEDYNNKYLGLYYGPTSGYPFGDPNAPASALVKDNLSGYGAVNYAFRISDRNQVPDSGNTLALLGGGFIALLAVSRRRKSN